MYISVGSSKMGAQIYMYLSFQTCSGFLPGMTEAQEGQRKHEGAFEVGATGPHHYL